MEGNHMTSHDAEQREAKKKGGKNGYIRGERGRETWTTLCWSRFNKYKKWHSKQGIDLVVSAAVLLIDNLCLIQFIILYVILWEQRAAALYGNIRESESKRERGGRAGERQRERERERDAMGGVNGMNGENAFSDISHDIGQIIEELYP